jgi:succinate dehydrogenase/fumarate reductase flavoprotein subunit
METIACDVLVVGSGAAGLTTAITAHHFGADVLVVEKASTFGGTTARSGGWLATYHGLVTDERTRVLDVERKPIPGLFAVGNDAASIFGGSYPGAGATLGPAMTFGYICGKILAESRKADQEAN